MQENDCLLNFNGDRLGVFLQTLINRAFQAGVATQVTARPNTDEVGCRTTELIQGGAIGAVREVHVWSNRPLWPQGMPRPEGEDPIPSTLDWKLWVGPAPMRPFKNTWPPGHLAVRQVSWKKATAKGPNPWRGNSRRVGGA